jgi:phage terminase large subunit-like protein
MQQVAAEPAAKPAKKQHPHTQDGWKYAKDVVKGKVPACKQAIQASQRALDDLERAKQRDWPYRFDSDKAERALTFLHFIPYIDGPHARTPTKWVPWQKFFVAQLFGWVHKSNGLRRFNRAHLWVAKGNGKTLLGAAIALYATFADGEMSAEGFAFAATREQAKLLWNSAKSMMLFAPKLCKTMGVEVGQYALSQEKNNSSFKALAAEADSHHGLRPQVLCLDELHVVDRELWQVLEQGLTKRTQPILLTTSTAGYDVTSIGFTVFRYCQDILEKRVEAENVLVLTYQADTDAIADWENVALAHPNLGVSVQEKVLRELQAKAIDLPSERNNFVTLSMNRWTQAREAWLKMEKWDERADSTLSLRDFIGRPAYIGLDMSQRNDITAKAYVFVDPDEQGRRKYTCFFRCYLPEDAIGRDDKYRVWAEDRHLVATPGDIIDFAQVRDELKQDLKDFPGSEVCYDPQFMEQMSQELAAEGIVMVKVPPQIKTFNPAMNEMSAAVYEGRLSHDGNPAVGWQVGNVTVRQNSGGMVFPAKVKGANKIDAAYALFTAMHRAMLATVAGDFFMVG